MNHKVMKYTEIWNEKCDYPGSDAPVFPGSVPKHYNKGTDCRKERRSLQSLDPGAPQAGIGENLGADSPRELITYRLSQ